MLNITNVKITKIEGNMRVKDIAHPINSEAREIIQKAVINEYEKN